jgi:intracellular sulfur oxidation DsrE/DsrF family protein
MTRTLGIFLITLVAITVLLLLLVSHSPRVAKNRLPPASISLAPTNPGVEALQTRYVFDVVIHRQDEMERLLKRIEELENRIETRVGAPELALVLHGPEIGYFTSRNYGRYMSLVDRAAALDRKGVLDVKVCDTMIRSLGLEQESFPAFIDHVPYGPGEIKRLVEQGYVKM